MKSKLKNFFREKKDLLIFMGVLILTFVSVFAIASIATKDRTTGNEPDPTGDNPVVNPTGETDQPDPTFVFALPFDGQLEEEYVITRGFFEEDLDDEALEDAVYLYDGIYEQSTGLSYSKKDNSSFDVLSIYPGKVISVTGDKESVTGYVVEIEHENNIVSRYSSLSEVSVKEGDTIELSGKIGVAGANVRDIEAGVHVHLEVYAKTEDVNKEDYINPEEVYGKKATDIVSTSVK